MKKIAATVFIKSSQAVLGINAQIQKVDFHLKNDDSIVTSRGDVIEWPNEESKLEVLKMIRKNCKSVFVVEFSPGGVPISESEIEVS